MDFSNFLDKPAFFDKVEHEKKIYIKVKSFRTKFPRTVPTVNDYLISILFMFAFHILIHVFC